jgi:hypothetical protein
MHYILSPTVQHPRAVEARLPSLRRHHPSGAQRNYEVLNRRRFDGAFMAATASYNARGTITPSPREL